jgi:ADP-ribose pyrophosphatase
MASPNASPSRWLKLNEKIVHPTRIFDLRSALFRHPVRGTEKDFFVVHSPDWVNVLALTTDHHLVLVNQFRFGVDTFSLEIPGGVIDLGEEPLDAGLRELREETGYVGTGARIIGSVHPNPAIMSNRCHFVLVEEVKRSAEIDWDPDEEIEVLTAPVDQVYEWAQTGKITHSLVLDALLCFAPRWAAIKAGRTGGSV